MLQDVYTAAQELNAGENAPSLKLALFAAAMSACQSLSANGRQTRILAQFVNQPLPSKNELVEILRPAKGFINKTHLKALYRIEELSNAGILDNYTHIGDTYHEQRAWREAMMLLFKGYGLAAKTLSFAALIYSPLACQLVPVDRHVMKRLGYDTDSSPSKYNLYLAIEARVHVERQEAQLEHVPLALFHWLKWEQWRVQKGVSKAEHVESHADLNCRAY